MMDRQLLNQPLQRMGEFGVGGAFIAIQTILIYANNILKNNHDEKYHRISLSNSNYKWRVQSVDGGEELLVLLGFKYRFENDNSFLMWEPSTPLNYLEECVAFMKLSSEKFFQELERLPKKSLVGRPHHSTDSKYMPSCRYPTGYYSTIGRRPSMEDELVILGMGPRLLQNEDFFAVYDGHGGGDTSKFLANNLHKQLLRSIAEFEENTVEAINHSFAVINDNIMKRNITSGSTAGIVYIKGNMIYFANCGDTRTVLSKGSSVLRCSVDHKPDLEEEKLRIESLNGFVISIFGVARVNGKLAVSRAFGDMDLHPLVTSAPYTKTLKITPDMNFIILACDGLWDEVTDEDAVELVKTCDNPHDAAQLLAVTSLNRLSADNISVIVIFLKEKENWTF